VASIFFFMVVSSCVWLIFIDPNSIISTALAGADNGLKLAVMLLVIYIFWMGLAEIAAQSGLIKKMADLLKPIIKFLFGEQTDEVNNLIATNISANMIGAGGAATPAAINAIEKMSKPNQAKATQPMIMLFILAATSLQLLPTTIIGILQKHGATSPQNIILPTFITSLMSTVLGVFLVRSLCRRS
jgi:spore maturation protein A